MPVVEMGVGEMSVVKMSVNKMTCSQNVNSWIDYRQVVICKNVSRQNET